MKKNKAPKTEIRQIIAEQKTVSNNTKRKYIGSIPCDNCDGIDQVLILKGEREGVYRLSEHFKGKSSQEDGISDVVSSGSWKFVTSKKQETLFLIEGNSEDSTARKFMFLVEVNKLYLLSDGIKWRNKSEKYRFDLKK